ncbi:hypothetical protein QF047_004130 [Arthrobacter sp. W4I7]|nr:hypothetical protein [Arthrobacter sp. W4I7]
MHPLLATGLVFLPAIAWMVTVLVVLIILRAGNTTTATAIAPLSVITAGFKNGTETVKKADR